MLTSYWILKAAWPTRMPSMLISSRYVPSPKEAAASLYTYWHPVESTRKSPSDKSTGTKESPAAFAIVMVAGGKVQVGAWFRVRVNLKGTIGCGVERTLIPSPLRGDCGNAL